MGKPEDSAEHEETAQGITYRLFLEEEEQISILDYCTSGDPDYVDQEKELAKTIAKSHDQGDKWAWFCARVEASMGGFRASVYCGCCSYKNKEEFIDCHWSDMKKEALDALREALAKAIDDGRKAEKALFDLRQEIDEIPEQQVM